MQNTIDIRSLPKAALLAALHNGTKPLGMGFLQARSDMNEKEAQNDLDEKKVHLLKNFTEERAEKELYSFDYFHGRPLKCDISGDYMDARLYDRDAGPGKAEYVINKLRESYSA